MKAHRTDRVAPPVGVAIYQRWSIHGEIEQYGVFKVAELAAAVEKLPRHVNVKTRMRFSEETPDELRDADQA